MKNLKLAISFLTVLLIIVSCQKDETANPQISGSKGNLLKSTTPDCEANCIDLNLEDVEYFEKTGSQTIIWGNPRNPFSKTVNIVYYNTEDAFILKVSGTAGFADVLVNGNSVKNFSGTIPPDTWQEFSLPLDDDWQACDEYAFDLKIAGFGPPAQFDVHYQLIGICEDCPPTVTDIDGNVYAVVKIGSQCWMAENLRAINYRDGSAITTSLSQSGWDNATQGAYAVYPHELIDGLNSSGEVLEAYGALYNWFAVNDARGICPEGWRVPTDAEWNELILIADPDPDPPFGLGIQSMSAGGKLKSTRTFPDPHPRWSDLNSEATDDFGFFGTPSGRRMDEGYNTIFVNSFMWSSTEREVNPTTAWTRFLTVIDGRVVRGANPKTWGLSVRCIKSL
jgi:uncharacterized protein (TIGR02145 family)